MADTTYAYDRLTDFATQAVEPAQFNDECVTAGYTPQKICFDHVNAVTVYIDDSVAKSSIDAVAAAHTPT